MCDLRIGEIILGRYEIEHMIGQGGLSRVYAATDLEGGDKVALKVLKPELASSETFIGLLEAEAVTLSSIGHEHIVKFRRLERDGDLLMVVMNLVEGPSLRELMVRRARPFEPDEVLELVKPLADALDYVHDMGIVHGDIKPSNVLMEGGSRPVLVDFGLARFAREAGVLEVPGTPVFMSPEQCRGELPTAASDIYSFGVMVYELLVGSPPFTGVRGLGVEGDEERIMREHLELRPPNPRDLNPRLSGKISAVVLKCLEKRPEDRWASLGELSDAFGRALDEDMLGMDSDGTQGFEPGSTSTFMADGLEDETVEIDALDWPPPPPESGGFIPVLPQETVEAVRATYDLEPQIRIDTRPSAAVRKARRALFMRRLVTILLTILLFIGLVILGAAGGWLLLQRTIWQQPPVVQPGVTVTFQGTLLPMPTGSIPVLPTSTPMYQLLTDIAEQDMTGAEGAIGD